jgi:psiF repeat-containing protein
MKKIILALTLSLLAVPLFAADAPKEATPQQNKMKTCNADATKQALKGDARKAFMKDCLSAKKDGAEPAKEVTSQQSKMKTCNADAKAKNLAGPDRQKFMSDCLKAK